MSENEDVRLTLDEFCRAVADEAHLVLNKAGARGFHVELDTYRQEYCTSIVLICYLPKAQKKWTLIYNLTDYAAKGMVRAAPSSTASKSM